MDYCHRLQSQHEVEGWMEGGREGGREGDKSARFLVLIILRPILHARANDSTRRDAAEVPFNLGKVGHWDWEGEGR